MKAECGISSPCELRKLEKVIFISGWIEIGGEDRPLLMLIKPKLEDNIPKFLDHFLR
jgi:hypothetical protein